MFHQDLDPATFVELVHRASICVLSSRVTSFERDSGGDLTGKTGVSFTAAAYRPGLLEEVVRSLQGALEEQNRLQRERFTGPELQERLQTLQHLYDLDREQAAGSFADFVGGFFEANGHPGEEKKIYESVQALFGAGKGPYSAAELDFAAVSVSAFQALLRGEQTRQMLVLHRITLEASALREAGTVSAPMAELVCTSGRNALRGILAPLEEDSPRGGLDLQG